MNVSVNVSVNSAKPRCNMLPSLCVMKTGKQQSTKLNLNQQCSTTILTRFQCSLNILLFC